MNDFLSGGGEVGALMRRMDWSQTALGPVDQWPQSLRTTVSTCLNSRFPILVWWGPELVKIYNDAYAEILADKHPRAMGQRGRDCWPEIWHIIGPMLEGVLAHGEATWSENQFLPLVRHGFAEECYFTFSYSPIRDGQGVAGVFCAVTETTRQVLGERRLGTLRDLGPRSADTDAGAACRRAAEVLAANPADVPFALVYLVDREGRRAELAATTGVAPGCAAAPTSLLLDGSDPWQLAAVAREGGSRIVDPLPAGLDLTGTAPAPSRALALAGGGGPDAAPCVLVAAGTSPRLELDERYQGFLEVMAGQIATAVSAARSLHEARERAEALAALDRAKTAFFSNVSHEFRTPLTLMLGPLEDALAAPGVALVGEDLATVHRNALRLLKLVNTLLDFSRIEAGRARARFAPVDLSAMTRETSSLFASAMESAGLRFTVRCDELPEPAWVDREMWEKVLLNLLSNALKYTFDGEVEVRLAAAGGRVVLSVRDTGVGIAAAELPRVFERFHRIEGTRARTHEGSGIGLALVQELVRMHGGEITAESAEGQGSTFSVAIPLGSAHLPADRLVAVDDLPREASRPEAFVAEARRWLPGVGESPSFLADAAVGSPDERDPSLTILVADDNADMREYLARLLAPRWNVEMAADGQAALEAARERRPALVLTDVMMPGLDGFGLLRALRADPATRSIPVILLSARAGEEARIEGLDAGADDYLVKPFAARELVARVATHLTLRRLRTRLEEERAAFGNLFTHTPVPVAIFRGPDLVFDFANQAYVDVVGGRDLVGRAVAEVLPEAVEQGFAELLHGVRASGEAFVGRETRVLLQRGGKKEETYFTFIYAPLRGERPEEDGVIALCMEVGEQVRARHQLEALAADAAAASRAKDEFMAMLGHELRNPLAPMLTALQVMRLRGLRSREQEILERQVAHLARLVDDLLDVSRLTRGGVELRRRPVELSEVVLRALEIAGPLLEQRRTRMELRLERSGLGVDADPERLAQVVSNLLTNAAKYSDAGTAMVVAAERVDGRVRLRVQDEGVGIAPEMLGRVFDCFVQQPQTLARSLGGLGLGLAIARSLVELHGGTIAAHSEGLGRGAEFVVELPAVDAGPAALHLDGTALPQRQARGGGPRVLLVDDSEDALITLRAALETLGCVVETAHDGPSALARLGRFRAQIALLDIGLPVMDGYELARRLRELHGAELRLVAVTGYGQESDRRRAVEAGFARHLVKPVDLADLAAVLEELGGGFGGAGGGMASPSPEGPRA